MEQKPKPKKIGRPLACETPEKFLDIANQYFSECDETKRPYTVNGLSLALGIDCKTFLRYGTDHDAFRLVVKKVRTRLEGYWESRLSGAQVAGAIFWLKNHGWRDTPEGERQGPMNIAIYGGLPPERVNDGLPDNTDASTSRAKEGMAGEAEV